VECPLVEAVVLHSDLVPVDHILDSPNRHCSPPRFLLSRLRGSPAHEKDGLNAVRPQLPSLADVPQKGHVERILTCRPCSTPELPQAGPTGGVTNELSHLDVHDLIQD